MQNGVNIICKNLGNTFKTTDSMIEILNHNIFAAESVRQDIISAFFIARVYN